MKQTYVQKLENAAEMLWVVIANVDNGDWTQQSIEWQEATRKWVDNYFNIIKQS